MYSTRGALARKHPLYLGEFVFGLKPWKFDRAFYDHLLGAQRAIVQIPIEHGKTTKGIVLTTWMLGTNPDLCLILLSLAADQAKQRLGVVSSAITGSWKLQMVFPERDGPLGRIPALRPESRVGKKRAWLSDRINVERSNRFDPTRKEHTLLAIGQRGKILGARSDGVQGDDLLDDETTISETLREQTKRWYSNTLVGRVVRSGFIHLWGTAWNELDLIEELKEKQATEKGGEYHVMVLKAGEGICECPEWPPERLQKFRKEVGELPFLRQMKNQPIGQASQFMPVAKIRRCQELCDDPADWFEHGLPDHHRDRFAWITAGGDLGMSKKQGSAETAFFVLGRDLEGKFHLLHLRKGLWVGAPILVHVLLVQRLFGVNEWMFETNAAQEHVAEMAQDPLFLEAVLEGKDPETGEAKFPELRKAGVTKKTARQVVMYGQKTGTNRDHERWGIRGLARPLEAETWRIPQEPAIVEGWIQAMRKYTPFAHPNDMVVAGWLAWSRMAGRGGRLGLSGRSV